MDRERIKQSLQLYDLMDDREEAERVVGEGVDAMCQQVRWRVAVRRMKLLIIQSLILPTPPIAPIPNAAVPGSTPLSAAFNALVEQLQSYRTLIDAGYEHGWDFLSQVIWPRVASAIKSKLGSTIFSAGRPDDLHEVCGDVASRLKYCANTETPRTTPPLITLSPHSKTLRLVRRRWRQSAMPPLQKSCVGSGSFPCTFNSDGKRLSASSNEAYQRGLQVDQRKLPKVKNGRYRRVLYSGKGYRVVGVTKSLFPSWDNDSFD